MPWAIKCRSENQEEGKREYLLGRYSSSESVPLFLAGYNIALFRTRDQARIYMKKKFNYMRDRPDLKREPHGWKMPIVVEVEVQLHEVEKE